MSRHSRSLFAVIALIVLSILIVAVGVAVGSTGISLSEVFAVVFNKLIGSDAINNIDDPTVAIVWNLRLPRALLAFFTGCALSASGAVVQSVLKNPLASPYTLGVSSGASLGAGLVIAFGITAFGGLTLAVFGTFFAIITVIAAIALATRVDRSLESTTIVLCGMVLSLFINALFTILSGLSGDKMTQILRWQMGSFSGKGWDSIKVLIPITVLGVLVLMMFSKELDVLSFGDETAASVGVETRRVKWILLVISSILTGTAVSFAGAIGFIDLVAPHIVRRLVSSKHCLVVPLSALVGGVFMVIADIVSRIAVIPKELPVSAVTALIGAPFFVYVFFKRVKRRSA